MKKPKFIFLIATFNRWYYIQRAIHSIYKEQYENKFIYVCDDGSEQKEYLSVSTKYKSKENIRWIRLNKNSGTNIARNTLLDAVYKDHDFGYIVFMDDDSFLINNSLKLISKEIASLKNYQWFLAELISPSGQKVSKTSQYGEMNYIYNYVFPLDKRVKFKGDFLHFIDLNLLKTLRFTTQFKNGEEWYLFVNLAKKFQCYILNIKAGVWEYLPQGLSNIGYNEAKKSEVAMLKLRTLEGFLQKNELLEYKLNVIRHLIKNKDFNVATKSLQKINKSLSFCSYFHKIRVLRYIIKIFFMTKIKFR